MSQRSRSFQILKRNPDAFAKNWMFCIICRLYRIIGLKHTRELEGVIQCIHLPWSIRENVGTSFGGCMSFLTKPAGIREEKLDLATSSEAVEFCLHTVKCCEICMHMDCGIVCKTVWGICRITLYILFSRLARVVQLLPNSIGIDN